jgi:hypothetical protein
VNATAPDGGPSPAAVGCGVPIYKVFMEEVRWRAVSPGMFVPVLTFEGKCSCFRQKRLTFQVIYHYFFSHLYLP